MKYTVPRDVTTAVLWSSLLALPLVIYLLIQNASPLLVFGALGLILVGIILFIDPGLGLLTLLVIRPMVDILGERTLPLFSGLNVNLAAGLGVLVVIWAVWFLLTHRVRVWKRPLFWPLVVFFSLSLASIFFTETITATVTEILRLASLISIFFMAGELIIDRENFRRFNYTLGFSLVVPLLVAGWQFITNTGLTFAESVNRVYGTFGHPNVLAFYLVLSLMYFLGLGLAAKKTRVWIIGWLVMLLMLVLAGTRGAWVGLVLALAFFGLFQYRRWLAASLVAVLLLVAFLPLLNNITSSYLALDLRTVPIVKEVLTRQTNTSSFDWRVEVWQDMRQQIEDRPLFGAGLGSFPVIRQRQVFDFFQGTGAHNDYLRLAVELGLAGLASYLALVFVIFRRLVMTYRQIKAKPVSLVVLGMIGFMTAFLFMSFFDNLLQGTPVMWMMWACLAVVINLPRIAATKS